MKTYNKFLKLNIDCSSLGLAQNKDFYPYFCTPKGAKIIGSAGVDGIHYCFIRGFSEMIFVVSPANLSGDYVHPIAKNFEDLLCLLVSCGDMAAIEQAHLWDRELFNSFLEENKPTTEQVATLNELKDKLSLLPMEDPFAYIKELQAAFDYSKIKYTADYYDEDMNPSAPVEPKEWKVYYGGGYWGHHGRGHAGEEIVIDRQFCWDDEVWHVPAVYACGKGLVVDYCIEIEPDKVKQFFDQWESVSLREDELTREQRERLEQENPLNVDFCAVLSLNGREMQPECGAGLSWIPEKCLPEGMENSPEAKRLMEYYGLDAARGWSFQREFFPWVTRRKPEIKSLRLKLERQMTAIPGPHFKNPSVGDVIPFTHPVTGAEYKLTVQEYEQQELPVEAFGQAEYEFPTHHTSMVYTLEPELSDRNFQVRDCLENEEPKRKTKQVFEPQANCDAFSVSIIGGADGPTAIMLSKREEPAGHAALSALHFETTENVEWKMVFREKLKDDLEVDLINAKISTDSFEKM